MRDTKSPIFIRKAWGRVAAYADHSDPMVAACNLIALVVASNQPFYPLYVFWMVSDHVWPTFFTFLSTPLFLAVPALARRWPVAGRALLPIAGLGNTVVSAKVFGPASGVEIFLIPCALISATFFRSSERQISFLLIGATFLIYFGLHGLYGTPAHLYSPTEYFSFSRLNAMSAATLTIFIGLIASGLISQIKTRT
ncbi:hypothetical protein [Chelatococcus asaccharovorans]|uniref:hypothetical protein n=1 Tax=Chelatococcus asaccharovorans TaxID=28210 RepID=UPI00224C6CEF|nr:hypothetical protein [Chelatococcus asaccharovorans]CAH1669500.1 conserved membrane hypothetical protein [Chelatococcus asaccharovorans]CAH1679065.1 conserved membrane hypothetical protein [Chelatococcus asaccharovorans]